MSTRLDNHFICSGINIDSVNTSFSNSFFFFSFWQLEAGVFKVIVSRKPLYLRPDDAFVSILF